MKTRYKIHRRLFRRDLIVLQIEVQQNRTDPRTLDAYTASWWRNARASDYLELINPPKPDLGHNYEDIGQARFPMYVCSYCDQLAENETSPICPDRIT